MITKIKASEEENPPGLSGVQSFGGFEVSKVFMVSPHKELMVSFL